MERRSSTRQPGAGRVLAAALAGLVASAPFTAARAAGMPRAGALFLPSEGVPAELAADLTEVLSASLESGGAAEVMAREPFEIILREVGGGDPAVCLRDAGCAREAGRRAELDFVVVAEAQRAAGGFQLQLMRYSVALEILRTVRFDLDEKLGQLAASLDSARGDLLRPDGALLRVDANVEDAAVLLDGVLLGVTPLAPREILPGTHELVVRHEGWLPASAEIACAAAAPCRVSLRLLAKPQPEPVAEPTPPEPPPREPPPVPPPPERGLSVQRILAWTSVGVAVAAGATGTAFAVRTGQIQDEIDSKCDGGTRTCTLSRDRAQSLQDDGELMATLTNVFYGVAGAAAVTAVVLFLTEPDDEPARVEVVPQASADGFGVGAVVRF